MLLIMKFNFGVIATKSFIVASSVSVTFSFIVLLFFGGWSVFFIVSFILFCKFIFFGNFMNFSFFVLIVNFFSSGVSVSVAYIVTRWFKNLNGSNCMCYVVLFSFFCFWLLGNVILMMCLLLERYDLNVWCLCLFCKVMWSDFWFCYEWWILVWIGVGWCVVDVDVCEDVCKDVFVCLMNVEVCEVSVVGIVGGCLMLTYYFVLRIAFRDGKAKRAIWRIGW